MRAEGAIVVLGMHRSGTSCLAGMLAAAGLASAGDAVRNWDNARGHHEMLDAVRLNEAVLAHGGGHWLAAPAAVTWTDAHAAERDRLLRASIDGRRALIKDPRTLLALPFWRASPVAFHAIAIVRHPLAVARSLESWRGMPLGDGVALWLAHVRALAADRAAHKYTVVDFEQPAPVAIAAVAAACRELGCAFDEAALAGAYVAQLVHHDDGDAPAVAGLDAAVALYRELVATYARVDIAAGAMSTGVDIARRAFPRAELAAFEQLLGAGDLVAALARARAALASIDDAAAALVPISTALVRRRALAEARALIEEHAARLDAGLADLLLGKVALAARDAGAAVRHLEAACGVAQPFFQARHLLPHALRAAGRGADARAALGRVAREALYPHGPLATLAEWSWLDGDRDAAVAEMRAAVDAAPQHRRGRLRTRLAEWLIAGGAAAAAREQLEQATAEDPAYSRSRDVLASISPSISR